VIGIWINDAVMSYGAPLVEDPSRYGYVNALGLDETLFYRKGPYHNQNWCTTILDTEDATLLDVVPDKDTKKTKKWIANQPKDWRDRVTWGTLDGCVPKVVQIGHRVFGTVSILSSGYRTVIDF